MLIRISVPTYKANSWGQFDKQGEIQVSAEVDNLSEGYAALKVQIDELLTQTSAENQIVANIQTLNSEIERRQSTLRNLNEAIERAKEQLQRLEKFLRRLGIDPSSYSLHISSNPALDAAIDELEGAVAVEAEVDPIPFDLSNDDDDCDDVDRRGF
jgi:DNA repair exonuclease SbcCD ATPase subunit